MAKAHARSQQQAIERYLSIGPPGLRHGLARGYTIEVYRIERVLGAGGFGVTYLATEAAIRGFWKFYRALMNV